MKGNSTKLYLLYKIIPLNTIELLYRRARFVANLLNDRHGLSLPPRTFEHEMQEFPRNHNLEKR